MGARTDSPAGHVTELDKGLLVGLYVPLALFLMALKWKRAVALGGLEPLALLDFWRSDVLFHAAFLIGSLALLALAPRRWWIWVVRLVVLLAVVVVLFAEIVATINFLATFNSTDFASFVYAVSQYEELAIVLTSIVSPRLVFGIAALPLLALGGAFVLAVRSGTPPAQPLRSRLRFAGLAGAGAGALLIAAMAPPLSPGAWRSAWCQSTVWVAITGLTPRTDVPEEEIERAEPLTSPTLRPTSTERPPNLVMILLESTGSWTWDPLDPDERITPNLTRTVEDFTWVGHAWTVVPHTTKVIPPVLCGRGPFLDLYVIEGKPSGLPVRCLPDLLGEHGYRSVFFRSAIGDFEGWYGLADNVGFDEFWPLESMDAEGFEVANYFGVEDAVMLEPSRRWLEEHGDEPFFALYLTGTPHHDYQAPRERYGFVNLSEVDVVNRYLNSIRYLDYFLVELLDQYRELGLWEDTVFVVLGDHGEAFGQHRAKQHDFVMYEEVLSVPLMIRSAGGDHQVEPGRPIGQWDLLPTTADLLGFEVVGGDLPGRSIFSEPASDTHYAVCRATSHCMASVRDGRKLIHWFGDRPDELYDLNQDPGEVDNLASTHPEEVAERLADLLQWYWSTKARWIKYYRAQGVL